MNTRAKAAALAAVAELAENAWLHFAPIRERGQAGQIGADAMHEKMSDATAKLFWKLDQIHFRLVAPHVWVGADHGEIVEAFANARAAITEASLEA